MRKVILGCGISLDGYIARPDGGIDFLIMPRDAAKMMADFYTTVDAVIFGRKTLEAALEMGGGSYQSPAPIPTYVFSRSQPPGERNGVTFVNQSPASFIRKLRKRPGKNIYHMGGGELARSFLEADLVDELSLGIVPVLIGKGLPLFPQGFPQRNFTLVENKTYSKGLVVLNYKRVRPKTKRKS
jgi:dihydrofolate reductase